MVFPHGSVSEESACNAGDPDSIHGLGRSPGEENGYHYSCMEIPMDKGAWRAIVSTTEAAKRVCMHARAHTHMLD